MADGGPVGSFQAQYFGPTNSSNRATASRFATEMILRFICRQWISILSRASVKRRRMSYDSLQKV
jgi:hypothetical protein